MINQVLRKLDIKALNPMQDAVLEVPSDRDILLLSPTGSGKTLGFLLPLLDVLKPNDEVQVLILVPSRELALQIEQVFKSMGTGFKVNCCYGGHDTKVEVNNFAQPPAVLIGTPGRVLYHIRKASFNASSIHTLVLDEFDKALEFGFQPDMAAIIGSLKGLKKRILTSATRMDEIPEFAGVTNPVEIDFLNQKESAPALAQKAVISAAEDKLETLFALICKIGNKPALIFCNHREAVDRISDLLYDRGVIHDVFHGGMEQEDREKALIKFRNGSHSLLITTDLASRGLDIPEIEYIIHYQLPVSEGAFVHRNGRTARMMASGTSYIILTPDEDPKFLKEVPEVENLPDELVLPEPTKWNTLYIGAGKKDKINKTDIVGLLLKKGGLAKEELGLIEVLDYSSFAAVARTKIDDVVRRIRSEKLKNKKVKIEVSR